jgi:hypothetical protein
LPVALAVVACSAADTNRATRPGPKRLDPAEVRRVDDRLVSATRIEWDAGPCKGMTYAGAIADDVPHGTGTLMPARNQAFRVITGQFDHGQLVGEADASVVLTDGSPTHLHGELEIERHTCSIVLRHPEATVLDEVPIEVKVDGVVFSRFAGVVRTTSDRVAPWRGAFEKLGSQTSYVYYDEDAWKPGDPLVCLVGNCIDGPGIEHLGGGSFELFEGTFRDGARHDLGTAYLVRPLAVTENAVDYGGAGEIKRITRKRSRYAIVDREGVSAGAVALDRYATIEGLSFGISLEVGFSGDALETLGLAALPESVVTQANVPARTSTGLAVASMLLDEFSRVPNRMRPIATSPGGGSMLYTVTDGARAVMAAWIGVDDSVEEAWLATWNLRLVPADDAELKLPTDGPAMAKLHGTASVYTTVTKARPTTAVYYDGVRIDPLGFTSTEAYERASPTTRKARAKKLAKTAAAARAKGDRLVLALRRIHTGAITALNLLETATTAFAATATDADGWERIIRSAHAAVEQADDAVIDASIGVTESLKRLDWSDPCAEPLATVAAELKDLDGRLRVILRELDAFEYSADADRLATIAHTFAADVAGLPTQRLATDLVTFRAATDGAPPALPAIRKPSPPPP